MSHSHGSLISVEQAISRLTAGLSVLPAEQVPLSQALGRVLAEQVRAPHPLPPFDHSAMDGYAVRSEDVLSASQQSLVELQVIGEAAAGHQSDIELQTGQAARITTGAPIPAGADCVVPVEATDNPAPMGGSRLAEVVRVGKPSLPGEFVRTAGMDIQEGEVLLPANVRLRAQDVGLLGAVGAANPLVRRRPHVAVLSSGDEVIEVDQDLAPGLIRDSNGLMISASLQTQGAQVLRLGIARDDRVSVKNHLDRAVKAGADLILSSAGVSMGAHDYIRLVIEELGELSFWRVNVRPGKPLTVGNYRGVPFMGLPGNPVSAWITFALFVRPSLAVMQGQSFPSRRTIKAELTERITSDGRESFLRAVLRRADTGYQVKLTGNQDSALLSSLVKANGLIIIPPGVETLEQGSQVEVWLMGEAGMVEVNNTVDEW